MRYGHAAFDAVLRFPLDLAFIHLLQVVREQLVAGFTAEDARTSRILLRFVFLVLQHRRLNNHEGVLRQDQLRHAHRALFLHWQRTNRDEALT